MEIIYEINDVFPTGKGSSRRTSNITNTENYEIDINISIFCREKSTTPPIKKGSNITRINPKMIRQEELAYNPKKPEIKRNHSSYPYPISDYLVYRNQFDRYLDNLNFTPDIIHCRSSWGGLSVARRQKRPIFVYETNGLASIELPYIHPEFQTKYRNYLDRISKEELYCAFHADSIVVVSEVSKHYLTARGIPEDKIEVIPNGVNFDVFRPQHLSFEEKSQLLNSKVVEINEDDLILGFVGSFQPWQGLKSLVRVLPELIDHFPNIKLVLVGKHKYSWRKELRNIVKTNDIRDHLIIKPHTNDLDIMPLIINSFDIAIAPFERTMRNTIMGFNPIKIYEYIACGKPVIATDLPAIREILMEDDTYLINTPEDDEFASDIVWAIKNKDLLENRSLIALERLKHNNADWESRVRQLQQLYQKLMR